MQLFYSTEINNTTVTLRDEEFRHCIKVLRKGSGDEINITDGKGNLYSAQIGFISKHHCEAEIIATESHLKAQKQLHIAIAPTKNMDRIEWAVEKMVEIGVSRISFILCEHSERKVLKPERLKKIALSAMKQSLKYHLPQIDNLVDFKDFVSSLNSKEQNLYMGYCESEQTSAFTKQTFTHPHTVVLIGPEGDFSPTEVDVAQKCGVQPVSFGSSRLRTETAAVVATTLINSRFEVERI